MSQQMDENSRPRGASLPYKLPTLYDSLFTTNDPPLSAQLVEIADSVRLAEGIKTCLEMQITETQMQLLRLEREALHATHHLERCKYPLAPIRRVPTEILAKIFVCYADLMNYDAPSSTTATNVRGGVWILGHVCGRWRVVALTTQTLWSSFAFNCSPKMRDASSLAEEFLVRSGNRPLSVNFSCAHHDSDSMQDPIIGDPCRDIFDALLARSRRWELAKFRVSPSLYRDMAIIKGNLPILRKLQLCIPSVGFGTVRPLQDFETFRECPRLVDLTLLLPLTHGDAFIAFPWHQLKRYHGCESNGNVVVLRAAPNIRQCRLVCTFFPDLTVAGPLVHQLCSLDVLTLPRSFDHLVLPSLEHLSCFATDASVVRDLLRRSTPPLLSLKLLRFDSISETISADLLDLLRAVPTLERLTIHGHSRGGDPNPKPRAPESTLFMHLVRALDSNQTDPSVGVLPALKQLTLSGIPFDAALVCMVESRQSVSAYPPGARLESVSVSAAPTNTENLLRLRHLEVQSGLALTIRLAPQANQEVKSVPPIPFAR
ncbi:hypothetical protein B0H11DRAFT_1336122 [Mycena galericulata]|nr:hypothetical protein B0H11DRAFT_1336122 [Mycena galericulata]